MKLEQLPVGTRVFNGGDMANSEHFGTITEIKKDKWGEKVQITPDADSERTSPYWISVVCFSEVYKGHGGTRFVTEEAHAEFRKEQLDRLTAFCRK